MLTNVVELPTELVKMLSDMLDLVSENHAQTRHLGNRTDFLTHLCRLMQFEVLM